MGGIPYKGVKEQNQERRAKLLDTQNKSVQALLKQLHLQEGQIKGIVSMTVTQLVQELNNRKITSLQIIAAYTSRTGTIGVDLCLITDPMFDQAIKAARQCDKQRNSGKKKNWTFKDGEFSSEKYLPPLFGIPISIKDTFDIQGMSSTIGLKSRVQPKKQSSPIYQCFINSGMIPFTKSNIPQMAMTFQSMNELWGRACNPWNKDRATGGSSGGEGGLIAADCSPIGIGSDIGGSIRIPAQFCGVCGIKPSSARLSAKYHTSVALAFNGAAKGVPLCLGPLAKSVNDMALELKVLYDSNFYEGNEDPYIKMTPFNDEIYLNHCHGKQKYTIGYFTSLRDIQPTKASIRAVQQTVQMLKKDGHNLEKIEIPNEREILKQFFFENLATGALHYRELLKGQEAQPEFQSLFQLSELWAPVRGLVGFIGSKMSPRLHFYLLSNLGQRSALEFMHHLGRMQQYKQVWVKFMKKHKLDFIICPGMGAQAVPHGKAKQTSLIATYTFLWNVLDAPSVSLPITVVKENQQQYQSQYNDLLTTQLKDMAKGSAGMPVGIQVIGCPLTEEKLLGFCTTIEQQVKFSAKHKPNI